MSRVDQNPELQCAALRAAGCHRIFVDSASGAIFEREELSKCLDYLRDGDTLVVWKLDRLGRSIRHLIDTVTGLEERGVNFRSITEGFDTNTSGGRLIFHVLGALAEFERDVLRERTIAGLAIARAEGRMGGRRNKLTPEQWQEVRDLFGQKMTITAIAKLYKVSRQTIYRVLEGPAAGGAEEPPEMPLSA